VTKIWEHSRRLTFGRHGIVLCGVTSRRTQSHRCSPFVLLCFCQVVRHDDNTCQSKVLGTAKLRFGSVPPPQGNLERCDNLTLYLLSVFFLFYLVFCLRLYNTTFVTCVLLFDSSSLRYQVRFLPRSLGWWRRYYLIGRQVITQDTWSLYSVYIGGNGVNRWLLHWFHRLSYRHRDYYTRTRTEDGHKRNTKTSVTI